MKESAEGQKISAAKRRKSAAHGASRGAAAGNSPAPEGRKKLSRVTHHDLRLIPIPITDEIHPGDSLADKLLEALRLRRLRFQSGDILIVKHKIVSKPEGR